jgi:lipoprotein-anchoring transpeptidase ErfK/SrfK
MRIDVHVPTQTLRLFGDDDRLISETAISTGRRGVGEVNGSEQTPRGWHQIRAKIGAGQPAGTVFVARRPTGEIYAPSMRQQFPERDWILTRILWLSGLEPGRNRLGNVDTMRRFIYIHGCPDEDPMGTPGSRGCIKMRNSDLIRLFDTVPVGTRVHIIAGDTP